MPGFDEECKELQMRARRLKKAYNRNPSADTWEEYRVARAVKGRVIDKKKRDGYRNYCQKACDSPKAMWQACKTARRPGLVYSCLPSIQQSDKSTTNNPEEKVEIFKNAFFPAPPIPQLTDIQNFVYPAGIDMPNITEKEIELAIFKPALDKAPGTDGIPNRVLRAIVSLILPHLYRLFNSCLSLAYYPRHFKKSTTIILRKPFGEESRNYTSLKSYRPIALLNTLGKALESILATRISYLVEIYGLLPSTHIGGRRGRFTEEALHEIVEKVYAGWNKDQVASLLMLDISGAYDHVCQHRLQHNLRKRHLNLQLVDLISSFLSG